MMSIHNLHQHPATYVIHPHGLKAWEHLSTAFPILENCLNMCYLDNPRDSIGRQLLVQI